MLRVQPLSWKAKKSCRFPFERPLRPRVHRTPHLPPLLFAEVVVDLVSTWHLFAAWCYEKRVLGGDAGLLAACCIKGRGDVVGGFVCDAWNNPRGLWCAEGLLLLCARALRLLDPFRCCLPLMLYPSSPTVFSKMSTEEIRAQSYVGFDSITQQIEHKLLKRGFQFNVIVVGMYSLPLSAALLPCWGCQYDGLEAGDQCLHAHVEGLRLQNHKNLFLLERSHCTLGMRPHLEPSLQCHLTLHCKQLKNKR